MSALMLRVIACVAMVIDHIGYLYSITLLRCIGRIAFPLFLFLIYNGYQHTSNRKAYALRLAIFAVISQIPYSLFIYNRLFSNQGNVFFTLLLTLACIWQTDVTHSHHKPLLKCLLPTCAVVVLYELRVLNSDYGARGILMGMLFYFLDGKSARNKIYLTAGMLLLVFYDFFVSCAKQFILFCVGAEAVIPAISTWMYIQIFSLGALPFVFLYNGRKGWTPTRKLPAKIMQYGFYVFYPLHQLILWAIWYFT